MPLDGQTQSGITLAVGKDVSDFASNIANLFGGKGGGDTSAAEEVATSAQGAVLNTDNILAFKQSVLAVMGNDPTSPEWLAFLANTPTNQFDVTVDQGNKAIAAYKERVKNQMPTQTTTSTGTGTPAPIGGLTPDISSALNSIGDSISALTPASTAPKPGLDWTQLAVGAAALVSIYFLIKKGKA